MPLISVIVPVYNAESFLHICVDSILKQTFHDFELMLIDDGSKDNSFQVMQNLNEKDKRINFTCSRKNSAENQHYRESDTGRT